MRTTEAVLLCTLAATWVLCASASPWSAPVSISTTATNALDIAPGDFDGDGDVDVALSRGQPVSRVTVHFNLGTSWSAGVIIADSGVNNPSSIDFADVDGDAIGDLIVSDLNNNRVRWFKGDGSGGFASGQSAMTGASGAIQTRAFDMDSDGDNDLVVCARNGNDVFYLDNDGAGSFTSTQIASNAVSCQDVAVFNGDADPALEVAAASHDGNGLIWIDRTGVNDTAFDTPVVLPTLTAGHRTVLGLDVDNDNVLDLVYGQDSSDQLRWRRLNDTTGPSSLIAASVQGPRALASIDANDDGLVDLLVAAEQGDEIAYFENMGGSTFSSKVTLVSSVNIARGVVTYDFDGDGDLDVFYASHPNVGYVLNLSDRDMDGFSDDVDCNDTNSNVYPGAPEQCDGLDNDCDMIIPVNETDGDGDGQRVCQGDCDDGNEAVYLGAAEVCDGVDNNCVNGTQDEDVPTWYRDADADGYGNATDPLLQCMQPHGYVVDVMVGDCNDDDPTIFPGADEACDGVDSDCDGNVPATEDDADGDGYMHCQNDCDDTDGEKYPGHKCSNDGAWIAPLMVICAGVLLVAAIAGIMVRRTPGSASRGPCQRISAHADNTERTYNLSLCV